MVRLSFRFHSHHGQNLWPVCDQRPFKKHLFLNNKKVGSILQYGGMADLHNIVRKCFEPPESLNGPTISFWFSSPGFS